MRWQTCCAQDCEAPPAPSDQSSAASTSKYIGITDGIESLKEGETLVCNSDGEQCQPMHLSTPSYEEPAVGWMFLQSETERCRLVHGQDHCWSRQVVPQVHALTAEDLDQMADIDEMEELDITVVQLVKLAPKPTARYANHPKQFDMRISFSEEGSLRPISHFGDLFVPVSLVDDPIVEEWLRNSRETNIYPVSPRECQQVRYAEWEAFTAISYLRAMKNIRVKLPHAPPPTEEFEPLCELWVPQSPLTLGHLAGVRAHPQPPLEAEQAAAMCLAAFAGLPRTSTRELGTRIATALQESATLWVLATAAALYWKAIGNSDHAIACLRQALQYVPKADRDIPLIHLANLLHSTGFYMDALVVAKMALDITPMSVIAHFTIANLYTSLGKLENAIAYHRALLLMEPTFEPAHRRMQSILCSLVFKDYVARTGP